MRLEEETYTQTIKDIIQGPNASAIIEQYLNRPDEAKGRRGKRSRFSNFAGFGHLNNLVKLGMAGAIATGSLPRNANAAPETYLDKGNRIVQQLPSFETQEWLKVNTLISVPESLKQQESGYTGFELDQDVILKLVTDKAGNPIKEIPANGATLLVTAENGKYFIDNVVKDFGNEAAQNAVKTLIETNIIKGNGNYSLALEFLPDSAGKLKMIPVIIVNNPITTDEQGNALLDANGEPMRIRQGSTIYSDGTEVKFALLKNSDTSKVLTLTGEKILPTLEKVFAQNPNMKARRPAADEVVAVEYEVNTSDAAAEVKVYQIAYQGITIELTLTPSVPTAVPQQTASMEPTPAPEPIFAKMAESKFNENASILITKDLSKITIDNINYNIQPLRKSFSLVDANGKSFHPDNGVYANYNYGKENGGFEIVGILVGTGTETFNFKDPNTGLNSSASLNFISIIVPLKNGEFKKIKAFSLGLIHENGGSLESLKNWNEVQPKLKIGNQVSLGILPQSLFESYTPEKALNEYNIKSPEVNKAQVTYWLNKIKNNTNTIHGITTSKSTDWINIFAVAGISFQ